MDRHKLVSTKKVHTFKLIRLRSTSDGLSTHSINKINNDCYQRIHVHVEPVKYRNLAIGGHKSVMISEVA